MSRPKEDPSGAIIEMQYSLSNLQELVSMIGSESDQHVGEIQRIEQLQDRLDSDDKYDFNTLLPDLENLFQREMRVSPPELQDLFGCSIQILQEVQDYLHIKAGYDEDLRNEHSRHELSLNQVIREISQCTKSLEQNLSNLQDVGDRPRMGTNPYTRPFVSPMATERTESHRRPSSLQRLMSLKLKSGVGSRETSASREIPGDSSVMLSSVGKDSRLESRDILRKNELLQTEIESLRARLEEKDKLSISQCKWFESKSKNLELQFEDFKRVSNDTCKKLEIEVGNLELKLKQFSESSPQQRMASGNFSQKEDLIKKLREENQQLHKEKYSIMYNLEEKEQALSSMQNQNDYHKRLFESKKAEIEKLQRQLNAEADKLTRIESEKTGLEEKLMEAKAKYYEELNKLRIQLKVANEKPAIKSRFCSTANMNIEVPQTTNSDSLTKETQIATSKLKPPAKPVATGAAFNKPTSLAGKTWEERKNLIHGNPDDDDDDNRSQKSFLRSVGKAALSVSTQKKKSLSKSGSDSNVEEDLSSDEEAKKGKGPTSKTGPKIVPSTFKGATPRMMQPHVKHNHQSMSVPRSSSNNAEIVAKATISPGPDYKQRYLQIKTKLEGLSSKLGKRESQVGQLKRELALAKQDYINVRHQREHLKEQLVERERILVQFRCREEWSPSPKPAGTNRTGEKNSVSVRVEEQHIKELKMRVQVRFDYLGLR